ncbi:MAG: ABC transporter ATP-binding protein [Phycisphaerales bacterium]|nr:ABC transporter ATP-binding protein [Phycisphaerales bacterium]
MTTAPAKMTNNADAPLLAARDLRVTYSRRGGGTCVAVDGVTFEIARGETLGLVGESGCGKTSLGRALLGLIPVAGGNVTFDGQPIEQLRSTVLRKFRRRAQLIFQDAAASLNPRMRVGAIVADPLRVHGMARGKAARERVEATLAQVGLDVALINRYPHELSGGERQRVDIARALVLDPEFLVCDEPVSAVDACTRVALLDLLRSLQRAHQRSYLFITHDLAAASRMCDRVAVMQAGRIVELGATDRVLSNPQHPCTRQLRSAVPTF